MRKTLNENPVIQVVMIGLLGIVVAFLFMSRVMKKDDTATTTDPAATSAAAVVDPAVPAIPGVAVDPAAVAPASAVPPAAGGNAGFSAGTGLPKAVVDAYDSGDVVVLLVTEDQGIEDRSLRADVGALKARPGTAVFTTNAQSIARFSRIASGVSVQRVPALVVIQPKRLADGPLPVATVSYGFRGENSVRQAVHDALYTGKQLSYDPG